MSKLNTLQAVLSQIKADGFSIGDFVVHAADKQQRLLVSKDAYGPDTVALSELPPISVGLIVGILIRPGNQVAYCVSWSGDCNDTTHYGLELRRYNE